MLFLTVINWIAMISSIYRQCNLAVEVHSSNEVNVYLRKTPSLVVSGVGEIKRLPEPESQLDLESAVLNAKDLNGLDTWKSIPSIQQVFAVFQPGL